MMNQQARPPVWDWEQVYESEFDRVYRYAFSLCGGRAAAEDIAQESFLRLFRFGSSAIRNPRAWLFRVAHRLTVDNFRGRRRQDSWTAPNREVPSPEREFEANQMAERITEAVGKLTESQRSCITLREYGDLSYKEIAEILEISVDQVKVNLYRARRNLMKDLEDLL